MGDVFSALLDGVARLFFVDSFRLDTTGMGEAHGAAFWQSTLVVALAYS